MSIAYDFVSQANVATERPERYGKQLVSHMGRKTQAEWLADEARGSIVFGDGLAVTELRAAGGSLQLVVRAQSAEDIARFEHVVGIHLVRFGRKDELECQWFRQLADGEAVGSKQSAADLDD